MTTITINHTGNVTRGALQKAVSAIFATDRSAALMAIRIALGVVILPHGLQKTMGWFGGHGFTGTMGFFGSIGIPAALGFLAILAESAGAAALIAGVTTRIAAFGIAVTMLVAATMHKANGFFMNWSGTQNGEGFEFHILAVGMAVALMIGGAGRYSLDRVVARES